MLVCKNTLKVKLNLIFIHFIHELGPYDNDDESDNEVPRSEYPPTIRPDYRPTRRPTYRPYPPPEPEGEPIPPRVRPGESSFTVHIGERAEFNCNAEGNTMRTEWRRADNRPLPLGARIYGGQLVIENVRLDAAGSYQCIAYDPNTRQPFTLLDAELLVIPGPPKITLSPTMPIQVKSGRDVEINCDASGEGPIRVHWHGDGGTELPR